MKHVKCTREESSHSRLRPLSEASAEQLDREPLSALASQAFRAPAPVRFLDLRDIPCPDDRVVGTAITQDLSLLARGISQLHPLEYSMENYTGKCNKPRRFYGFK